MRCGDCARARARALVRDRALVRGLALDRALARDLARSIDLDLDVDLARAGPRALDRDLHHSVLVRGSTDTAAVARAMPAPAIRGIVGLAVRWLPVAQRPRYREEFSNELAELPRSLQREYALRVLVHAWGLRRALVEMVRTSDGEPVRRAER
jgi:hypothetical protein